MVCIDQNSVRELVENNREFFKKIASKGNFESSLRKLVNKAYLVLLFLKLALIGIGWLALTKLDPIYGMYFLLGLVMVQAKFLLDAKFVGLEDNIFEAAKNAGICEDSGNGNLEKSSDECNSTKEASEDSNPTKAKA